MTHKLNWRVRDAAKRYYAPLNPLIVLSDGDMLIRRH